MLDDLDRPLGQDREPPPEKGRGRLWLGLAAVALVAVGGAGVALRGKNAAPGGEPVAVAPIQPAPPPPVSPAPAAPPAANPAGVRIDGVATAEQVETESGVKIFRGNGGAPGAVIIQVPDSAGSPPLAPAPDRRLVEKSRFGLLPRRGKDGATPAEVYARPLSLQPPIKPGTPRIAILVGGMGLNAAATDMAIQRLPAAVSLAFAPYGDDVERQAGAARDAGHEILLQTPLEPFDLADSPGPHVLMANDGPKALDDLRWQMGRFVGYIGLVNFLGGRFTADRGATQFLMRELSDRGLDYVDDGSSPQSVAGEVAGASGVGFVKADLRIDASKSPEAIDAALFRLESLARQKGVAVGFAAGLPEANERIVRFTADLARRGVTLVPVSAVIGADTTARSEKR
ncbi:divergent polysaccharide deacetylase family protein [Rhodoblastus sp.]|uniref:divergent polysaccharide deacetylase family protein n=1 Tax=Rhodoblastus sp. TaxID=1962975 RepID=UPI0035B25B0B